MDPVLAFNMKNIQGIIDALNRTEFTDTYDGADVKYKINLGSQTKNEYGITRTRYYIRGVINVFNYDHETFLKKFGHKRDPERYFFNFFMQKAYDVLIKKLSIDQFVLLDPKHDNGNVAIFCFSGSNMDGGPVRHDEIPTSRAVSPWQKDLENKDWFSYYTERFEKWSGSADEWGQRPDFNVT
jgi:hypothetical protein